jgi:methylmalonyl-CoA mutase N-terminal domain/subunit
MTRAVESGWAKLQIEECAARKQARIDSGQDVIVGVNKYRTEEEPDMPIFRPNPESERKQIARLEELRRTRDQGAVDRALGRLREVTVAGDNVVPATLEAVEAYATVGEICEVWRKIFGEFVDHPVQV